MVITKERLDQAIHRLYAELRTQWQLPPEASETAIREALRAIIKEIDEKP